MLKIQTLGQFISEKRIRLSIDGTELAEKTGVSAAYINMLERGKRNNPSKEFLKSLETALKLSSDEIDEMYELYIISSQNISPDLAEYAIKCKAARQMLRAAMKKAPEKEVWNKIFELLK